MDKVKSALMAQVHEVVGSPEITYSQARAEARNAVISSRKLDLFDSVREEGNRLYLMSPGAANMARTIGAAVASVGGGYSGMVMGMTKQQFLAAAEEKLAPLVEAHAKNVAFAAAQRSRSTNPSTAEATRADSAAAGHAAGRAYLTVPFASKDSAKAAGAKWDGDARKWYWSGKHDEMPSDLRKFYSGPMAGFSS